MAVFVSLAVHGQDYPWLLLSPENDSRDAETCQADEAWSSNMIQVINQNETLLKHHIVWRKGKIKNLLAMDVPFCELHFDAINSVGFSAEEKSILTEYLKRGGFILFFMDAYPYYQDDFWRIKEWPVIDFLTKELPASDPDFTTGKATEAFPFFKVHYQVVNNDATKYEIQGNPNTPDYTLLYYRNRVCCLVEGDYGYFEDGAWFPVARPFPRRFSTDLQAYRLIVNLYIYAMVQ